MVVKRKKRRLEPWELAKLAKYEPKPWMLDNWCEEVSRITLQPFGGGEPIQVKLTAYGMGMPPTEFLETSVVGLPVAKFHIGVDRKQIERLAVWLIECMYLLDSLREKKDKEIRKVERQLAEIHERKCNSEWSKKSTRK